MKYLYLATALLLSACAASSPRPTNSPSQQAPPRYRRAYQQAQRHHAHQRRYVSHQYLPWN